MSAGPTRRFGLDAALLEDRVLYSAVPLPAAESAGDGGGEPAVTPDVHDLLSVAAADLHHRSALDDFAEALSHEPADVVLVDTQLADSSQLADAALPDAKVFRYDGANQSADSVLHDVVLWSLENQTEIASLSILSHGTSGAFQLGSEWITTATLADTADAWHELSDQLTDGADIYILGCNVGDAARGGQQLVDRLATVTGADVFASDDLTGVGGDWVLEVASAGDQAAVGHALTLPLSVHELEAADVSLAWFDANWQFRQNVLVSEAMIPDVSDLSNFAVLVTVTDLNLQSVANGGDVGQADGGDFVFTAADGSTQLDHEIEFYDPTTGQLFAWVEVPTLSFGTDTSLYMYYGNAGAADQWDINGTWDANFDGVWHLGSDYQDSTANANHGTNNGTTNFAGAQVGSGDDFDGATSFITTGSNAAQTADDFTISLWFNSDDTGFAHHILWEGDSAGDGWGATAPVEREMHISMGTVDDGATMANQLSFFLGDDADAGNDPLEIYTAFADTAGWHHVTVVVSNMSTAPSAEMFLDGGSVGTDTSTLAEASRATWDTNLRFGRPGQNTRHYDGGLDEVRVATAARSAEWVATEFNNQDDPASYLTFGPQVAAQSLVVAVDDAPSTPEDTPAVIDLDANDTDADGDAVSVIDFTQPATGTVTDNGDGTVTYTPVGDDSGSYAFDYMAIDAGAGLSHFWGLNGDAADSVGGNDGAVNGAATVAGSFGTALTFDEINDRVVIPDFAYTDSFSISFEFKVDDNSGSDYQYFYSHGDPSGQNSVNVYLGEAGNGGAANILRTALADNNDAVDELALDYDLSGLIGDGNWHTYTLAVGAAGANVYVDGVQRTSANRGGDAINPAGNLFLGVRQDLDADRFYGEELDNVMVFDRSLLLGEVSDLHAQSNRGTATVTVTAENDAPVVTAPAGALSATEQTGQAIHGTGFGVSDVDEGGLGATATLAVGEGTITVVAGDSGVTVAGGNGTGTVTLTGSVAQLDNLLTGGGTGTITYFNNSDTPSASTLLTVTVNDQGHSGNDPGLTGDAFSEEGSANQTINITAVNDEESLATNSPLSVNEGAAGTIDNAHLLTTDVDNTPAQLTYTITSATPNGQVLLSGAPTAMFSQADVDAGLVTYQHNGGETVADSFDFDVDDGLGTVTSATFAVNVTPQNDAPVLATNTGANTVQGGMVTLGAAQLSATDVDNLPTELAYTVTIGPSAGQLELTTSPGVPIAAFTQDDVDNNRLIYVHDGSFAPNDGFTFTVSDGAGGNIGATAFDVTIATVNQPPTAADDAYSLIAATSLNVAAPGVLAGDSDPDGDPLTAVLVAGPANGGLTFNADGSFTYTPNPGFVGTDTIQYRASDGTLSSGVATVTIDVIPPLVQPPADGPGSESGDGGEAGDGEAADNSDNSSDTDDSSSDDSNTEDELVAARPRDGHSAGRRRPTGGAAPAEEDDQTLLEFGLAEDTEFAERTTGRVERTVRMGRGPKNANSNEPADRSATAHAGANLATADLWSALDTLGDEIEATDSFGELVAGTATVLTGALSTGYVVWAVRGGYLMAGMLSSIPTWRFLDPLPILQHSVSRGTPATTTDDDEQQLSLADLLRERHLNHDLQA